MSDDSEEIADLIGSLLDCDYKAVRVDDICVVCGEPGAEIATSIDNDLRHVECRNREIRDNEGDK